MAHGESPRHQARKRPRSGTKAAPRKTRAEVRALARAKAGGPGAGRSSTGTPRSAGAKGATFDASVRLQKLLASAGFGSRREVERFIREERVTVNGRVAKLGDRADPSADEIRFDGERLLRERPAYWIVNKPRGVVTTVRDDEGRRTVVDLLPPKVGRLFPVGRLDRETSGLVLMTNDGDVAHVLLHPSLGNEREYRVNVKGQVDSPALTRLGRGVTLDEGRTSPARVSDVRFDPDSGTSSLSLTLSEGKKRQIRRSLLVLGFPVRRLVRVRMGPLRIGRLAVGEARPLRSEEKRALLEHVRRLRAGEVPTAAARGKQAPRRVGATRKAPASPPRSKTTRRTRGDASAKSSTSDGGRRSGGTTGAGKRKKATSRKSATKKRAGTSSRKPGAKRKASASRGTRTAARVKDSSSGRPAKRPANKASGPSKPAASRKPAARRGQRTVASRKGVRK
ncbi:MAG: pseudouridine synthase [bacterium]|nr:hypothetical protein [Deltaproteobacteria bacterium]MCP4908978.1 pseudouridine synthase [bacterium]